MPRLAWLIFLPIAACSPAPDRGFDGPDPSSRLNAVAEAARTRDTDAIPNLIDALRDPDPAVRLLAGATLERITDHTMPGAVNQHPSDLADAWRAWVNEHPVRADNVGSTR